MPRNGCLRVLDPSRGDIDIYAKLEDVLTSAIPLSDPSRIITNTSSPAVPMFFSEPKHEWCYYFTKAELAQQTNDLQKVVSLGNEAIMLGFKPNDQNEWLIFIEAYALTGDIDKAKDLSSKVLREDPKLHRGICIVWEKMRSNLGTAITDETLSSYQCNQ
jgi:hypothetical protein